MTSSICILSVEKFELENYFKNQKELRLVCDGTTNLGNYDSTVTLASPETIIQQKSIDDRHIVFSVKHYSDIIEKPIRTWSNHIIIDDCGYQVVYTFEMVYDKKDEELYVMMPKHLASQFIKRLSTKKDIILVKKRHFNLNMTQIKDIINIYGSWFEVNKENIRCEAKFGVDVLDGDIDTKDLIAINMKVKCDNEVFNVTLSREGQISSMSKKGTSEELIRFYKTIKPEILKTIS